MKHKPLSVQFAKLNKLATKVRQTHFQSILDFGIMDEG